MAVNIRSNYLGVKIHFGKEFALNICVGKKVIPILEVTNESNQTTKTMKKFLVVICMVAFGATVSFAQSTTTKKETVPAKTETVKSKDAATPNAKPTSLNEEAKGSCTKGEKAACCKEGDKASKDCKASCSDSKSTANGGKDKAACGKDGEKGQCCSKSGAKTEATKEAKEAPAKKD